MKKLLFAVFAFCTVALAQIPPVTLQKNSPSAANPNQLTANSSPVIVGNGQSVTFASGATLTMQSGSTFTPASGSNLVTTDGSYANPSWITSLAWGKITSAPAFANTASTYSDPSWITALAWSKVTGSPTFVDTAGSYTNPSWIVSLPYSKITGAPSGTGTVTSVAATVPSGFAVSGSPITTSGTLALSYATGQAANSVLSTPNGTTGALAIRQLVAADIPTLTLAKISDAGTAAAKAVAFFQTPQTSAVGYGITNGTTIDAWGTVTPPGSQVFASSPAHYVLASPTGSSGVPSMRALAASDIPFPTTAANSLLGNNTSSATQAVSLSASQVKTLLAINYTDVIGLGDSAPLDVGVLPGTVAAGDDPRFHLLFTQLGQTIYAGVDSGNPTILAGNTTTTRKYYAQTGTGSGSAAPAWVTIAPTDLPTPTPTTLGGVFSKAAVSHFFVNQVGTDGAIGTSQPAASDLSNGVTGSGAVALAVSPVFTTPNIGVATGSVSGSSGNSPAGSLTGTTLASNVVVRYSVANIAALRALNPTTLGLITGAKIRTLGYTTQGDGGDSEYAYDSGSSATDNGGTIIQTSAGSGRFLMVDTQKVSILQFGASTGSNDNQPYIQAALNSGVPYVEIANGVFLTEGVQIPTRTTLRGRGRGVSTLKLKPNALAASLVSLASSTAERWELSDMTLDGNRASQTVAADGLNVNGTFDGSAVLAASTMASNDPRYVVKHIVITATHGNGMTVTGRGEAIIDGVQIYKADGVGLYIDSYDSEYSNISVGDCGLHAVQTTGNCANVKFSNVKAWFSGMIDAATSGDGFYVAGTRLLFSNCEAQDTRRHGWNFVGARQITLSSCRAESPGYPGNPATGFLVLSGNEVTGTVEFEDRDLTPAMDWGINLAGTSQFNTLIVSGVPGTSGAVNLGVSNANSNSIIYSGNPATGAGSTVYGTLNYVGVPALTNGLTIKNLSTATYAIGEAAADKVVAGYTGVETDFYSASHGALPGVYNAMFGGGTSGGEYRVIWSGPANVFTTVAKGEPNGDFGVAGGGWNTGNLLVGSRHVWVDGSGNLRIKGSAPTGDTDGNVLLSASGTLVVSGSSLTGVTPLGIRSSGSGAFDMTIANAENLTASRSLAFTLGDASRTLTLSGNPTLGDWFNQSLKTNNAPTFAGATINNSGGTTTITVSSDGFISKSAGQPFQTVNDWVFTKSLTSSGPTQGIGYSTGAGGTVTQATSKATAVTLNKTCGQITMNNAALAAGAYVSFVVNDTACAATDAPYACISSGGTANAYEAKVTAVAAGSFTVTVQNITAGSLSEAPVVTVSIFKVVTS